MYCGTKSCSDRLRLGFLNTPCAVGPANLACYFAASRESGLAHFFTFTPKAKYRTTEVRNHRKILDFSKLGLFLTVSIWFCSIFCGESESVHPGPPKIFGVRKRTKFPPTNFEKKDSDTEDFLGPWGIRIRILRRNCCRLI